jgi:hypothetical protein
MMKITKFTKMTTIKKSLKFLNKGQNWLGIEAHACNPCYLEGRGQEDHGSRPPWTKTARFLSQQTSQL